MWCFPLLTYYAQRHSIDISERPSLKYVQFLTAAQRHSPEIKCLILENVLLNCALTGLNICGVLIYGDIYIFHAVASFQPCGNGSNLLLGRFLCDNCSQSPGHLEYSGLLPLQSPLCPNSAPPKSTKDAFLLNKRVCKLIHIHWHRKGCEKSFHR